MSEENNLPISLAAKREEKGTKGGEPQKYLFFNITAEVTYVDQIPPEGEPPVYKKEKVEMLYRGSDAGISGREWARIKANFIVQFQNEYAGTLARFTRVVPEVTKAVVISCFPLGLFTDEEFSRGVQEYLDQATKQATPPEKK